MGRRDKSPHVEEFQKFMQVLHERKGGIIPNPLSMGQSSHTHATFQRVQCGRGGEKSNLVMKNLTNTTSVKVNIIVINHVDNLYP